LIGRLFFYFLLHLIRRPIKPIAHYDASIILFTVCIWKIVYLLNLLCMLEFYTTLMIYVFFLASQWFHTFKLFSNLHFLGLAFFYNKDVFGKGSYTTLACFNIFYFDLATMVPTLVEYSNFLMQFLWNNNEQSTTWHHFIV